MNKHARANYYKMFPEHNFALVKLEAEKLYYDDLERLNHDYKRDANYSKIRFLLIDIDKKCKIAFGLRELHKLAKLYNDEPQENNHEVIVWMVSQPIITALTHIFVGKIRDNSKYCSTLKKAYYILGLEMGYEMFQELVHPSVHRETGS